MATNISHEFNIPKDDWMGTLKRSLTSGRRSKNTFTPNPENNALANKIGSISRTATLGRFQKKEEIPEGDAFYLGNRVKTLKGIRKGSLKVAPGPLSALEQAKKLFVSPEQENFNAENRSISEGTLISKASNKIIKKLHLAKNSFQNESYKDAKEGFKKINQSKPLYQEKATIELYLATIYLLQGNIDKAKKYLEGKPARFAKGDPISFAQAMYSHVSYLITKKETPEKIRGPCLISQLYKKVEGFSVDERIMAKALHKKFCMSE